eukprot:scaffold31668_cov55-Attheya_sp.AAC.1
MAPSTPTTTPNVTPIRSRPEDDDTWTIHVGSGDDLVSGARIAILQQWICGVLDASLPKWPRECPSSLDDQTLIILSAIFLFRISLSHCVLDEAIVFSRVDLISTRLVLES